MLSRAEDININHKVARALRAMRMRQAKLSAVSYKNKPIKSRRREI